MNGLKWECEISRRMKHRELMKICYNNFIIIVFYQEKYTLTVFKLSVSSSFFIY